MGDVFGRLKSCHFSLVFLFGLWYLYAKPPTLGCGSWLGQNPQDYAPCLLIQTSPLPPSPIPPLFLPPLLGLPFLFFLYIHSDMTFHYHVIFYTWGTCIRFHLTLSSSFFHNHQLSFLGICDPPAPPSSSSSNFTPFSPILFYL